MASRESGRFSRLRSGSVSRAHNLLKWTNVGWILVTESCLVFKCVVEMVGYGSVFIGFANGDVAAMHVALC